MTDHASTDLDSIEIPSSTFDFVVESGGIKKIKTSHRRADSMIWADPNTLYRVPGFNVRIRDESYIAHVRALADSMLVDGFLPDQPISVVVMRGPNGDDVMAISNGHSRHEAVLLANQEGAGIEAVPVLIAPRTMTATDMTVALVKSNTGRPLSTYETALVVKRLLAQELTEAEISRRLGLGMSTIANLVLLASAPPALSNLVVEGKLSASLATQTIREHGMSAATTFLKTEVEKARATGAGKLTRGQLPATRFDKVLRKSASELYQTAQLIVADPGFRGLNEVTRRNLDALLAELARLKQEAEEAVPPTSRARRTEASEQPA